MKNYINSSYWIEYSKLMEERPELFINSGILDIVTDPEIINDFMEKNNKTIGVLYKSDYSLLVVDLVKDSKVLFTYERLVPAVKDGAVVIVPKYGDKYVLLNQHRHSIRQHQISFPRGFGEKGISSSDNVIKEIEEELGTKASNINYIGSVSPDSGISSNIVSIFTCDVEEPNIEEGKEGITNIYLLNEAELEEYIKNNRINDSFTLSAYLYIKLKNEQR